MAPWYAAVLFQDAGFARHFFLEHNLRRFLGGGYHDSPVWFYVPVLLIGCFPWSGLLLPLTWFLFNRSPALRALQPPGKGFLLLWAGWCLLFFSLSRGKLPPYILPAMPAIALLCGAYLEAALFQPSLANLFHRAHGAVPSYATMVLSVAGPAGLFWAWSKGFVASDHAVIVLGEAGLCGLCLGCILLRGRKLGLKAAWAVCRRWASSCCGRLRATLCPPGRPGLAAGPIRGDRGMAARRADGRGLRGGGLGFDPIPVGPRQPVLQCPAVRTRGIDCLLGASRPKSADREGRRAAGNGRMAVARRDAHCAGCSIPGRHGCF